MKTTTMMKVLAKAVLLVSTLQVALAVKPGGFLDKSEIPSTGEKWVPMDNGAAFQPTTHDDAATAVALKSAQRRFLGMESTFVDGTETYYDDYAQSWRLIGMYIDCNAEETEQEADERRLRRRLNEDDEDQEPCERYLLWAAYIDMDYSGGGIGEYRYWNRSKDKWSNSTCTSSNGRCEKMDCHLPNTNKQLLGYFKEPNWAQWMEQLFKHEGICIWTSNEYNFMQNHRQSWPEGCTATSVKLDGKYLYYDTKPLEFGGMGIGLYTDSRCSIDYSGLDIDPDVVLASEDVSKLAYYINDWNEALDIFKTCQPCVAYSLKTSGSFDCADDAGYTNVNQCMKFATHTTMMTADFPDLILAAEQGTITQVTVGKSVYGSDYFGATVTVQLQDLTEPGWIFLGVSALMFLVGSALLFRAYRQARYSPSLSEPLVARGDGVAA